MTTNPESIKLKPKGFVQWANDAKDSFYWTDGHNVFRAPIHNAADVKTGYVPGRWESSVEHWNHYATAFGRTRIGNPRTKGGAL